MSIAAGEEQHLLLRDTGIPLARGVLLPYTVSRNMTLQSSIVGGMPWGPVPQLAGFGGVTSEGEAIKVIVLETPMELLSPVEPLDKHARELDHLNRFYTDVVLLGAEPPYHTVERGQDPPDFLAFQRDTGRRYGIECASLTDERRRALHALFGRVRREILSRPRHLFRQLVGTVVVMWFRNEDGRLTRPPRRTEADLVREVVDRLEAYRPNFDSQVIAPHGVLDAGNVAAYGFGTEMRGFAAIPFRGNIPTTRFFVQTGFEMTLAATTEVTASDVVKGLEAVLAAHDKPGVATLLLTAGGPDENGLVYLSDDLLAAFLIENFQELPKTEHIEEVIVHRCLIGSCDRLLPGRLSLGPFFSGFTPGLRSVVPQMPSNVEVLKFPGVD